MSVEALEGKLLSRVTRTIHAHELIREGDLGMVCLSGGKEMQSLTSTSPGPTEPPHEHARLDR